MAGGAQHRDTCNPLSPPLVVLFIDVGVLQFKQHIERDVPRLPSVQCWGSKWAGPNEYVTRDPRLGRWSIFDHGQGLDNKLGLSMSATRRFARPPDRSAGASCCPSPYPSPRADGGRGRGGDARGEGSVCDARGAQI